MPRTCDAGLAMPLLGIPPIVESNAWMTNEVSLFDNEDEMNEYALAGNAGVYEAPTRATEIAALIRDSDDIVLRRRQPAQGWRCSTCHRDPPSGTLFEIEIRQTAAGPEGVRIGPVCAGRYLLQALRAELRSVLAGNDPNKAAQERRLRSAIAVVRNP